VSTQAIHRGRRPPSTTLAGVLAASVMILAPRAAFACPVCFGANDSPLALGIKYGILVGVLVYYLTTKDFIVYRMVEPFWMHFKAAHLETSPGDQAASALNVDQYTKTHTVLIENMAAPSMDQVAGDC